MNNKTKSKSFDRRGRRGVGVIIGGVILIAVLLTSVFAFYVTILNNDKARSSYEIQSQQQNKDKDIETFVVDREITVVGGSVDVNVNNTGSIPMVASRALVYCSVGCTNSGIPIQDSTITTVLNPGETYSDTLGGGLMASGNTYTISVISERGNIISSTTCTVEPDGGCSEDDGGAALLEAIVQGTGSVQLDYKAFGAIYVDYGTRDGVPQRGWEIVTPGVGSSVHGYPGFDIMSDVNVIFVQSMRNLDPSENDLTLSRSTSLLTNIGKEQGNQPSIAYICKEDFTTNPYSMDGYHETTANKILPGTPLDAEEDVNWQEVYFCSQDNPGSGVSDYQPRNDFNIFHPLFVVIRGTFSNSNADYGQTIPYQSVLGGQSDAATFEACIYDITASPPNGPSTACPGPTVNNAAANLEYFTSLATLQAPGDHDVWIHVDSAAAGTTLYATWIYPDGTSTILHDDSDADSNVNRNIRITIPEVNSDGSPLTCSGTEDYYALKVNADFDTDGQRNVYYMTYKINC